MWPCTFTLTWVNKHLFARRFASSALCVHMYPLIVLLLFEKEHMIFLDRIETFVVLSPSVFHSKPSNHNHRHIFVFFNILRVVGYFLLTSVISNGKKTATKLPYVRNGQVSVCHMVRPYGPECLNRWYITRYRLQCISVSVCLVSEV